MSSPAEVRSPTSTAAFVGLLVYLWLDFMRPHDMVVPLRSYRPMLFVGCLVLALTLWQRRRRLLERATDLASLLALVAVAVLETFGSVDRAASALTLLEIVKMTVLVWLLVAAVSTRRRLESVLWVVCASLAVLAAWAIAQGLDRGLMHEFRIEAVVQGPGAEAGGTFQDNNDMARVLAMSLPLWWVLARRGAPWKRGLALAGLIATVAGVEFTFSRSGFLAMLAGAAVVCLSYRPPWRGLVLFAACAVALLAVSPRPYLERIATVARPLQESSVEGRLGIWRDAARRAGQDVLIGRGPGTFVSAQNDRPPPRRRSSHNVFVEILTDMGLVGLAAFVWVLLAAFHHLHAVRRDAERSGAADLRVESFGVEAALVAYFVSSMALSSPFQSPPFVLIGLALALRQAARRSAIAHNPSDSIPSGTLIRLK